MGTAIATLCCLLLAAPALAQGKDNLTVDPDSFAVYRNIFARLTEKERPGGFAP